jgi:hypothetical protein
MAAAAAMTFAASSVAAAAELRMTVASDSIVRRTCPSVDCGGIGRFNVGESVVSYETEKGWVRVSPYYTAACYDGQSAFVQVGPAECTPSNGIKGGEFAEWVRSDFLTADDSGEALTTEAAAR